MKNSRVAELLRTLEQKEKALRVGDWRRVSNCWAKLDALGKRVRSKVHDVSLRILLEDSLERGFGREPRRIL